MGKVYIECSGFRASISHIRFLTQTLLLDFYFKTGSIRLRNNHLTIFLVVVVNATGYTSLADRLYLLIINCVLFAMCEFQ